MSIYDFMAVFDAVYIAYHYDLYTHNVKQVRNDNGTVSVFNFATNYTGRTFMSLNFYNPNLYPPGCKYPVYDNNDDNNNNNYGNCTPPCDNSTGNCTACDNSTGACLPVCDNSTDGNSTDGNSTGMGSFQGPNQYMSTDYSDEYGYPNYNTMA